MTDKATIETLHVFGGFVERRWFANGYGVSIAAHRHTRGTEVAVIHRTHGDWDLCYETPVMADVAGYVDEATIKTISDQVARLPRNDDCHHGEPR